MRKTTVLKHKTQQLSLLVVVLLAFTLALGTLSGCSSSSNTSAESTESASAEATDAEATEAEETEAADADIIDINAAEGIEVHVAALKGPTSMGLSKFAADAAAGTTHNTFDFALSGSADEVLPGLIQGTYDIAMIPSNMAAVAYNKTQGGVSVIDINTLGVLYVVAGEKIETLGDLEGRTVYMAGKAASPGYVTAYLLEQAGLTDSVTIDWKSENQEAAAAIAADPNGVAILPEPFVTATLMQNQNLQRGLKLSEAWDGQVKDGSQLIQGVTVVRNQFLEEHPEAVAEFLEQHVASVEYVNNNPEEAAQGIVDLGIMEKAPAAAKAIPNASIVAIGGQEMAEGLAGYLKVLFDADPSSVGGALPGDDFYYTQGGAQIDAAYDKAA